MLGIGKNEKKDGSGRRLVSNLRSEQEKFKIIVNTIEDGVALIDDEATIQFFNPGAGKITGWDCAEATGISVHAVMKLVDDKNQPYTMSNSPLQKVFEIGKTIRDNNAFLMTRSDKQVPISLDVTPLLDEQNRVTAAVAVFRNVTQERAEEKRRADFISTASHEMRTPVAAIEGYLALALNPKVSNIDDHARGYLEKAHISTKRLGELFQDLLTSARAEDGRLSSHPVVVELGSFLEQISNDLKFVAEKKGLITEFIMGSSETINAADNKEEGGERVIRPLYYVLVDPDRLREVVNNLFDNAVKYTDQGKISIGLTGDPEVVQFYIRDTGPGIPADDLPHLFQKFYRVDSSTTRTVGGSGLGLFISRKIVELYNGRIWVESELGKGSTFFINFPRLDAQKATMLKTTEAHSTKLHPINSLATS